MGRQMPGVDEVSTFLLELLAEEIPARMQAGARGELEKLFTRGLADAGVKAGKITVWSTPRRLALIADGLPAETQAVSEEIKGPRSSAPEQALEGFLRKTGLTKDQLTERDGVFYACLEKPGRPMADVLAGTIEAILRGFAWPKSMRWGADSLNPESMRWVRPLAGIVTLLDGEVVECGAGDIRAGRATLGHRFHSSGAVEITSAESYAEQLRAAHVIVDHAAREAIVREGAVKAATAAGLTLVADEGLVIENAGLTEWPVPLLGRFDAEFLEVPPEVVQLTARVNQKYFVCEQAGKLANAFICTANIAAHDGGAGIIDGNRKVLAARLSDARFFWQQDRKTTLEAQATKLPRITFHEKLGSVADKVERVAKLSRWLAEQGIVPGADPVLAEQAARLCKADLVTEMVGEFPELQGLMGGYYARAEGLPDAVADAIRDHYKPVGQGDDAPTAPVTVCVALADKIDSIITLVSAGEIPTGSKDPFALRRAALGIMAIVLKNQCRLSLTLIAWLAFFFLKDTLRKNQTAKKLADVMTASRGLSRDTRADLVQEIFAIGLTQRAHDSKEEQEAAAHVAGGFWKFMVDRLKVQQKEAGVRHDLIDAVFALGGEDDLVRLLARVHALQAFVATEDGVNLLAGYKRAANILKKEPYEDGPANPEPEPAEAALIAALNIATPQATAAVEREDFAGAMTALATLRAPIDAFFESVTVNHTDRAIRDSRLGLLDAFRAAVHKVADFSRIEG